MRKILIVALTVVLLNSLPAIAQKGQLVPIGNVPPVVREAADKATTSVQWLVAFKFPETGKKTWYRLAGRDGLKNQLVKVMIYEEGQIIDVRVEIPLQEVPVVVSDAVQKKFPNFKPKLVEAVGSARRLDKDVFRKSLEDLLDRLRKEKIQVVQCTLTSVGEKHDGTNKDDPKLEEFAFPRWDAPAPLTICALCNGVGPDQQPR